MGALEAGGRRNGLGEAGDPHDHQTMTQLLPRQTCIPVAVKLEVERADGEVGIPAKALEVGHWNAMSGQGCRCGRDSVLFRGVLGIRLRLVADDYLFAVQVRGECVRFATGWMGRWQAAVTVLGYCVGQ
jgi:hypothetical protein